jgi:very-short-patch-repair endonuclease
MGSVIRYSQTQAYTQIRMRLARKFRKGLINRMTKAETACETLLKNLGLDYVVQAAFLAPRSFYIVDFYIKSPYKMIIEVDGADHRTPRKIRFDRKKIAYFLRCGFKFIKLHNDMVLNDPERVKRYIQHVLERIQHKQNMCAKNFLSGNNRVLKGGIYGEDYQGFKN